MSGAARAVLVGGMHRSGTSMVGGMLASLGVDMGRNLIPADSANQRGYFEDADVVAFHGRMFRRLMPKAAVGHVDWGWAENAELDRARLAELDAEARDVVARRTRPDGCWGFKDPRATVVLDFWDRCVDEARFVLVYRHPWEVADSMQRGGAEVFLRNPSYGYRIWSHYNERMIEFLERNRERCALVSANALPGHLERFVELLRSRLGLAITTTDLAQAFEARLFTGSDPHDPRADLTAIAYPECMAILERLDRLADIPSGGEWRAEAPRESGLRRPEDPGPVDLSIVIPTNDDGELLLDAVASVERSRPPATELIIVNDGSTAPETLRILAALRAHGYFVLDQENGGLSSARNAGFSRARGRFVLPLDADNRLCPGFAEAAIEALQRDPELGVVHGDRRLFGSLSGVVAVPPFDLAKMLGGNYVDACAVFRRSLWENVGGYDTRMVGLEDWDFWLSAGRRGWRFGHLPLVSFEYRVRPGSPSSTVRISARAGTSNVHVRLPVRHTDTGARSRRLLPSA